MLGKWLHELIESQGTEDWCPYRGGFRPVKAAQHEGDLFSLLRAISCRRIELASSLALWSFSRLYAPGLDWPDQARPCHSICDWPVWLWLAGWLLGSSLVGQQAIWEMEERTGRDMNNSSITRHVLDRVHQRDGGG